MGCKLSVWDIWTPSALPAHNAHDVPSQGQPVKVEATAANEKSRQALEEELNGESRAQRRRRARLLTGYHTRTENWSEVDEQMAHDAQRGLALNRNCLVIASVTEVQHSRPHVQVLFHRICGIGPSPHAQLTSNNRPHPDQPDLSQTDHTDRKHGEATGGGSSLGQAAAEYERRASKSADGGRKVEICEGCFPTVWQEYKRAGFLSILTAAVKESAASDEPTDFSRAALVVDEFCFRRTRDGGHLFLHIEHPAKPETPAVGAAPARPPNEVGVDAKVAPLSNDACNVLDTKSGVNTGVNTGGASLAALPMLPVESELGADLCHGDTKHGEGSIGDPPQVICVLTATLPKDPSLNAATMPPNAVPEQCTSPGGRAVGPNATASTSSTPEQLQLPDVANPLAGQNSGHSAPAPDTKAPTTESQMHEAVSGPNPIANGVAMVAAVAKVLRGRRKRKLGDAAISANAPCCGPPTAAAPEADNGGPVCSSWPNSRRSKSASQRGTKRLKSQPA